MDKQEIEEVIRRAIELLPMILYAILAIIDIRKRIRGELPLPASPAERLFPYFSYLLLIELCRIRWAIAQRSIIG